MKTIKNFLKPLFKSFLTVRREFKNLIARIFHKSGFLSSLYYLLFSDAFHREHQAVLSGKLAHIKMEENYFLLIRNTHRIEKGLTMRPRRDVFAKGYLEVTISAFVSLYESNENLSSNQLKWSKDVLNEYFTVVKEDPFINKFKKLFHSAILEVEEETEFYKPYNRSSSILSNITYEEFYKLSKQRRSIRWFENIPVPRELIDKALLAALQSPSACNRQPFEYRIIDDKRLLKKIVDVPMGTVGYSQNIPTFVVVVGNLNAYDSERDRHLIYIDASLANMSFMYALETLGLGSCSINWPDIEKKEKKMEKILDLEEYQRPIMCLAVGYPDPTGEVAYSQKRNIELVRKYN